MRFSYKALHQDGSSTLGELEAPDRSRVVDALSKQGLIAIDVFESRAGIAAALNKPVFTRQGLNARQLADITGELATLVESGLNIEKALSVLHSLAEEKMPQQVLGRLQGELREGKSLSDAMKSDSSSFSKFYVSMINSGEVAGNLAEILDSLSTYLTRRLEIHEKIRSALIYPSILLVMVAVTMVIVLTVILPQFEPMFAQAEAALPWPTRFTLSVGQLVNEHFAGFAIALAVALTALMGVLRTDAAKKRLAAFWLRVPILGNLIRKDVFSRFHRMMGTLLRSGIPLSAAFAVSLDGVANGHIHQKLKEVLKKVREGNSLSSEYATLSDVPRLAIELTRVGEDTGRLSEMMLKTASVLERDVNNLVDRLMTMLVPALTITMGVVIAAMIASVLLGIISVNEIAF